MHVTWSAKIFQATPVVLRSFGRQGGVSTSPYNSLNISYAVGDNPFSVEKNRRKITGCLPTTSAQLVHGPNIATVTPTIQMAAQCDGLITHHPKHQLLLTHADCQVACFWDREQHKLALIHAGRKGLQNNIYRNLLTLWKKEGSQMQHILCAIAPSICQNCYNIRAILDQLPRAWSTFIKEGCLDLRTVAQSQLAPYLAQEQYEIASICTCCSCEDWFSYRQAKKTGRNGTIAYFQP